MSFDLAVWYERTTPTADKAYRKYRRLCRGATILFAARPNVAAFCDELLDLYPPLEDSDADSSPTGWVWAVSPARSNRAVVLCISWSRAHEVAHFVQTLAAQHGLMCYDPQAHAVYMNPPSQRMIRLTSGDGITLTRSSPETAADTGREILLAGGFVMVKTESEHWVQATRREAEGRPPREFLVKYAGGPQSVELIFVTRDLDEVLAVFDSFMRDEQQLRDLFPWGLCV